MTRNLSEAKQAEAYWKKRDIPSLLELYSAHRNTTDPALLYFAGLGFSTSDNPQKAIGCWRRAIEHAPSFEWALRALAYEMLDKQIFIDAAQLFERLDVLGKANADDLTALAEIFIKQGLLKQAYDCLARALREDPTNVLGLLEMAIVYANVGDKTLALRYLRRLAKTNNYDLSELSSAPEFEALWNDRAFKRIAHLNVVR